MENHIYFSHFFYQYLKNIGVTEDHIIKIALDDIESADLRAPLALYKYIKAKMVFLQWY